MVKLSNPKTMLPTTNWQTAINTIVNTNINKQTINFDSNIFILLYGFTSKSLIVPLLNSSLTIEPAITMPIIKINNS